MSRVSIVENPYALYGQLRRGVKKYFSVDDLRKNSLYGSGPDPTRDMISRRRILSRSRDDLNSADYNMMDEEEDVWYQKEKLYKDHIQEVLDKWTQIDDEIWAKVICLERNRRVAKAYARTPVLTINGSDDGFDGYRIGLCGFDNPMRDAKTEEVKRHIGHGVKIKMDNAGNILIKRVSKCNVFVKDAMASDENSISPEALKLPNGALEMEKPVKLFDMKKFQQNVSKELKRAYPDRRKLECQCMSTVVFVKHEQDILDCPCWIMLINIVAMDMLKSKLPPIQKKPSSDIRTRPRLPIPDEDPYSLPGSGSGSSSSRERRTDRPPKLPPRDVTMGAYHIPKERDEVSYHSKGSFSRHQNHIDHRMPDYDERSDENRLHLPHLQASSRKKGAPFPDDPYYCGMRAHIPNFAKNRGPSGGNSTVGMNSSKKILMAAHPPPASPWHRGVERSNYDSGLEVDYAGALEDPYASIYGRLPVMPRGYPPHFREVPSVGEWDGY